MMTYKDKMRIVELEMYYITSIHFMLKNAMENLEENGNYSIFLLFLEMQDKYYKKITNLF